MKRPASKAKPAPEMPAIKFELLSPNSVRILRILRATLQIKSEMLLLQDQMEGHDDLEAVRKPLADAAIQFSTDPFRDRLWESARELLMRDFARAFPNDVVVLSRADGLSEAVSVLVSPRSQQTAA